MAIQPLGNNQPPNNGERATKKNPTWLKVTLIVISLGLGAYGGYNYTSMPGMISMGCAGTLFVGTLIWIVKAKCKNTSAIGIEAHPSPKNLQWTRPPEREPISEIDAIELWGERVMQTITILQPPTDVEIANWLAIWVTDPEPLQRRVGEATPFPPPLQALVVGYCRSEFALLQEEWETIFDKNTDFRFSRLDGRHLDRVLQLPCPFWKGKRMIETHALIHFPGYQYHNTNYTVGQFFDLRPSPLASTSMKRHLGESYKFCIPTGLLVMPLGIIPDSEGQSQQVLCNFVATVNQFNVKKPSQLGDYSVDNIQTTAIALYLLNHVFPKQFFASPNQFTFCIKSYGFHGYYGYVGLDRNGEVQGRDTSRQLGGIAPVTYFKDPS